VDFEIDKTVQYWLDGAAYDLETGRALLESKRYPYALFFAHLAVEKALKALVVKTTREHAPFTHSLPFLASKAQIEIPESIVDQLANIRSFIWNRDTRMRRRIFIKNALRNLLGKSSAKWRTPING
jgi:HEPN domain-containing protein